MAMRVIVLGAGVVGISTAYFLSAAGVEVTVVDRQSGPGQETSARNGSILHPSLAEPWNSPGILRTLLASIGREDSAVLLRLRALPTLLGWGPRFLRESAPARFRANAARNIRLALQSLRDLEQVRTQTRAQFHWYRRGIMTVFRDAAALEAARRWYVELAKLGVEVETLDAAGAAAREPALADVRTQLAGATFAPGDEGGDPLAYCVEIARVLRERGVQLRFGDGVRRLERRGTRVERIELESGESLPVDRLVIATGSHSAPLARQLGLQLPVRPVKGYSLTLPRRDGAPGIPVADAALHMAVIPVGDDRIRVAGTAEFAGFDTRPNASRTANLLALLRRVYPRYAAAIDGVDPQAWNGLRPMTPDGVPLIGPTALENVWLNTGHGHLGWTLAAGSGRLLADLMLGRAPAVAADDYAPRRFG
jgi:D-amino-acid dehydrogenase